MASNYERMYKAVAILAGPGALQERLAEAYRNEVQYVGPEGLSDLSLVELANIRDQLTRVAPQGVRDAYDASASALSDSEADELVTEMLDIYDELARGAASGAPRRP